MLRLATGNLINIVRYSALEIFNAAETGLFFNLTLNTTMKFKSDKWISGELYKDRVTARVTVLVAANMTGREKNM